MIKKSEKLVCAYISLIGAKYDGGFVLKNLLFSAQELVDKANELFDDSNRMVRLVQSTEFAYLRMKKVRLI